MSYEATLGLSGQTHLFIGGFLYSKKTKRSKNTIRWRCVNLRKLNCSGAITTSCHYPYPNPTNFKPHSHPPQEMMKEVNKWRLKLREEALAGAGKPAEVIKKVWSGIPEDVQKNLGNLDNIKRDLRRKCQFQKDLQLKKTLPEASQTSEKKNEGVDSNCSKKLSDEASIKTLTKTSTELILNPADEINLQSNNLNLLQETVTSAPSSSLSVSLKTVLFEFKDVKVETEEETEFEFEDTINDKSKCNLWQTGKDNSYASEFHPPTLGTTSHQEPNVEGVPESQITEGLLQVPVITPSTCQHSNLGGSHTSEPNEVSSKAANSLPFQPLQTNFNKENLTTEIMSLNFTIRKLENISRELQTCKKQEDELDHFGKYLTSLLRGLPERTVRLLQTKIIREVFAAKGFQDNAPSFNKNIRKRSMSKNPATLSNLEGAKRGNKRTINGSTLPQDGSFTSKLPLYQERAVHIMDHTVHNMDNTVRNIDSIVRNKDSTVHSMDSAVCSMDSTVLPAKICAYNNTQKEESTFEIDIEPGPGMTECKAEVDYSEMYSKQEPLDHHSVESCPLFTSSMATPPIHYTTHHPDLTPFKKEITDAHQDSFRNQYFFQRSNFSSGPQTTVVSKNIETKTKI